MKKRLILAEKPSVAKDIARVLHCTQAKNGYFEGKDSIVTWALGHLVTLAEPEFYDQKYKTWNLDDLPMLPDKMKLTVMKQTSKQFNQVKSLLHRQDVGEIIIATDAGREGELVARWIIVQAKVNKPMKRLWISSVTDKAIKEGFQKLKPAAKYYSLYEAAQARAQADWYVGLNVTRALTTKFNASLNSGRVQTPVVAMVAKREETIRNFKEKSFYGIKLITKSGDIFIWKEGKGIDRFNRQAAQEKLKGLEGKVAKVNHLNQSKKQKKAPLLFDLTELQREAFQKFGYSPKETLNICQSLYESHKVLTYPRTDSRYLSSDMAETIGDRLKAVLTNDFKEYRYLLKQSVPKSNKAIFNDQKVSDHHAIIPTEVAIPRSRLSQKELAIYDLVVKRFIAVFLADQMVEEREIELSIDSEIFTLKNQVTLQAGWTAVYDKGEKESKTLHHYKLGEQVLVDHLQEAVGSTKAPAYFNEATLLSAMENPTAFMQTEDKLLKETLKKTGGLGTVATRADIMDKLFSSFLLEKKGQAIMTTSKGKQLLELVPPAMKSPELTSQWEIQLGQIEEGSLSKDEFIKKIKVYTKDLVSEIKKSQGNFKHDNLSGKKCPECGKALLEVNGKKGKLLVCQDRECGYRKNLARITNSPCPQCRKKLNLVGEGEGQMFVCSCGYREKYSHFIDRKKGKSGGKADKRSVQNYLKKQNKEKPINNALFEALKDFK